MPSPWGIFYCPAHDYETDHKLIEAMQPAVITIQDGGDNTYAWIRKAAPNTVIVAREWALGNQWSDLERDPIATGKHHAAEWAKKRDKLKFDPEKTRVAPVNEPECWSTLDPNKFSPEQREAQRVERVKKINTYSIVFASECEKYGLRAGVGKFSVGWPGDYGYKDSPINWGEYLEMYKGINWQRHTMILHEYWADLGPAESWGWWGGRARKMPWDIPYIIGECGFEMAVKKAVEPAWRGWARNLKDNAQMTARQQYAKMMLDYCNWMAVDPRLIGTCFFMLDHQDPQWASQDFSACWQEIIALKPQFRMISTEKFVPLPLDVLSPDKYKQPAGNPAQPPVVKPPVTPPVVPPVAPPPAPVTTLTGKVVKASPNDGTTYVYGKAPKGSKVFFSWRDSDPAAEPYVVKGDGTFNMPMFRDGKTPCAGDWDVWAVADGKTSPRVQFHTDGVGGKSNQIEINFAMTTVAPPVTPPTPPPPVKPPVTPPVTPPPVKAAVLLRDPLDKSVITNYFGQHPEMYAKFGLPGHTGIDYSCAVGTPVKAVADGTVVYTDMDEGGYGLYVRIWHKALGIHTLLGHLSEVKVKVGAVVKQSDVIALSGNTGNSTGPHLHYEVRACNEKGEYVAVTNMPKGAVDPLSLKAGLERGAALGGGSKADPFVEG